MAESRPDAQAFWKRFRAASQRLHKLVLRERLDEVFAEIEAMLAAAGFDYAFDVTELDGKGALILTPEGDESVAADIDRFLEQGGEVPGWTLYGRRQRKAPEDAMTITETIYELDLRDAKFTFDSSSERPVVVVYTSAAAELNDEEESEGLVMTLLDHALGESVVMALHPRVSVKPSREAPEKTLSLAELTAAMAK